jgi:hypothetical protein
MKFLRIFQEDLINHGGEALLSLYDNSAKQAVIGIYPEYNLVEPKFSVNSSPGNIPSQLLLLEKIAANLNVKRLEDWYSVTAKVTLRFITSNFLADLCQWWC